MQEKNEKADVCVIIKHFCTFKGRFANALIYHDGILWVRF